MNSKRNTIKKIAGVGTIASLLPQAWTRPVVTSMVLPAHAQTSDTEPPMGADLTADAGFFDTASGTLIAVDNVDLSPTVSIVDQPSQGAVVINGLDFNYEVTDGSGFFGDDSFTYRVTDASGNQSPINTVTIINILDT